MAVHLRSGTREYVVDLHLTLAQVEAFYAGHVSRVSARDRNGLRLEFPLTALRPHVDRLGVRGTFRLRVQDGRLQSLTRICN